MIPLTAKTAFLVLQTDVCHVLAYFSAMCAKPRSQYVKVRSVCALADITMMVSMDSVKVFLCI